MNPWKDSTRTFEGVEQLLQMASAVKVFDTLLIEENLMPVEPLKCKVDECVAHFSEITRLEEQIEKVIIDIEDLKFNFEYKDLLHSSAIDKKTKRLNEICDKIGAIVKNKRTIAEALQQKGKSSDALPLGRNFHEMFFELMKISASLIVDFRKNVAACEQVSTMEVQDLRKEVRRLAGLAGNLKTFTAHLEEAGDM